FDFVCCRRFSITFPTTQRMTTITLTRSTLKGCVNKSTQLYPTYDTTKIIIILPKATASTKERKLISASPEATLTSDEGVKGKQYNKNNGPNPWRSTQSSVERTLLLLFTK